MSSHRRSPRHLSLSVVALLITVALGSAVAVASGAFRDRSPSPRRGVASYLRSHFAVFRTVRSAHSSSDVLASAAGYPGVMSALSSMGSAGDIEDSYLGLDVADTVFEQTSGGPLWLVPGSNGACVVVVGGEPGGHSASVGCDTDANLQQGMSATSVWVPTHTTTIYGMTPNAAASASVISGQRSERVSLKQNGFVIRVHHPVVVKVLSASGRVMWSIPRRPINTRKGL